MKKAIIILAVAVLFAVTVSAVYAIGPGYRAGKGMGMGFMDTENCPNYQNLTEEEKSKVEKFRTEAQGIREQIHAKKTEIISLRSQKNPDWKAIELKQKEIVELRTQIQKQAHDEGITGLSDKCGCGAGGGKMMGRPGKKG